MKSLKIDLYDFHIGHLYRFSHLYDYSMNDLVPYYLPILNYKNLIHSK